MLWKTLPVILLTVLYKAHFLQGDNDISDRDGENCPKLTYVFFGNQLLSNSCQVICQGGSIRNVADTTECVFDRTNHSSRIPIKAGVCEKGSCISVASQRCRPGKLEATSHVKVARNCTQYCRDNTTKFVEDGVQCAITTSWRQRGSWYRYALTTGVCKSGNCTAFYNSSHINVEDSSCAESTTTIAKKVKVLKVCKLNCSSGDKAPCLYEERTIRISSKYVLKYYELGTCQSGVCKPSVYKYLLTSKEWSEQEQQD